MTTTRKFLMFVFALLLSAGAVVPNASAQTTAPSEAMFHFGAIHKGVGQAIVMNFDLTDHFGDSTLIVPVEFHLEDKAGNVLYTNTVNVEAGKTFTAVFAVGPEIRTARSTIDGDIYGAIAPEIRTIQPCIRVLFPPGPNSPVDRITASLEVMDILTGRVQVFNNTPRLIVIDTSTMPPPE